MKQTLLILLFISLSLDSLAYCVGAAIDFWPSKQKIKQNSIIIINTYGGSQKIIRRLNKRYPIYLQSGNHKVKLVVQNIYKGEFRITQAILRLEKKLDPNKEYQLFIDNLPEKYYQLGDFDETTKEHYFARWTVNEGEDNLVPKWTVKPIETSKRYTRYGCGPDSYVDFKFHADDKSSFVIIVKVKNLFTKRKTEYLLEPSDSTLSVGHGMCSGAFLFRHGNNFEVTFDIMDASGNLTKWNDVGIIFTKPKRPIYR